MSIVIIVVYRIVPECMDLPYCFNNEFCYFEGASQSHSDKSGRGDHSVSIKDEDSGEEIRVHFGYKGTIERGDWLKVKAPFGAASPLRTRRLRGDSYFYGYIFACKPPTKKMPGAYNLCILLNRI